MSTGVLCAVLGSTETEVVQGLAPGAPEVTVVRRCADLPELLAAAAAGLGGVAVVSTHLGGMDREAVRHLHDSGLGVVVVADAKAGWTPDRAHALGADTVLVAASAGSAVLAAVQGLLGDLGRRRTAARATVAGGAGGARPPSSVAARLDGLDHPDLRPVPASREGAHDEPGHGEGEATGSPGTGAPGTVVAVWGPTGAPGRTTVALNLAAELAALGEGAGATALLVDADTYGGTVAPMLGLLDEAPGVAAAARAASTGQLDPVALAALTPRLDGGLRVLTGISRADRWPELPAASLEAVWAAARELACWTVVDCGFSIEQDEVLSYDTRAPRRNGATLAALEEADDVVVVGTGDPIGLQRLVRALGELTDLGLTSRRHVVVNRVRATASGPRPHEAIRAALHRYAGVVEVTLVPDDRAACDGAVLRAATLREHAPASPVRRALADLAGVFLPAVSSVGAH